MFQHFAPPSGCYNQSLVYTSSSLAVGESQVSNNFRSCVFLKNNNNKSLTLKYKFPSVQVLIAKPPSLEITLAYKVGRTNFSMLGPALYKPLVLTTSLVFYFLANKARNKHSPN